jgi:AAA domain
MLFTYAGGSTCACTNTQSGAYSGTAHLLTLQKPFLQALRQHYHVYLATASSLAALLAPLTSVPIVVLPLLSSLLLLLPLIQQGPPGTGKTYITSLLAQIILAESEQQIVFECYTNHALDQILEHLLDAGVTKIVRAGGASASSRLEKYNLFNLERSVEYDTFNKRTFGDIKQQLDQNAECIRALSGRVTTAELTWDELSNNYDLRYSTDTELLYDPADGLAALTVAAAASSTSSAYGDAGGFTLVGSGGSEAKPDYLYRIWRSGGAPPALLQDALSTAPLWQLSPTQRTQLCAAWRRALRDDEQQELLLALQERAELTAALNEVKQRQQLAVLQHARVIGMTTTKAAMMRPTLEQLAPGVVIFEEAV